MDVETELDRLYSVPLEKFTEERNAIARSLKDAGDAAGATRVKKLAKPSVGAWTINQLARKHPAEVSELLDVRHELEAADSPAELRDLAGRRREIVARLAALAKRILEDAGHSASHSTVEKISQGLLATGSEEERELLRQGRLTREPASSGLDAFGFSAPVDGERHTASKVSLKTQREVDRLRREAERLQQEAARLEQDASFAEEQARRARSKAEDAGRAADEARARAEEAASAAGL